MLDPFAGPPPLKRTPIAPRLGSTTLFFVHIPKCAGTSFRRLLKRWYGPDVMFVDHGGLSAVARAAALRKAPPKAIAGHFAFGVHHALPCQPYYASLVRHPLDRFVSLYRHARAVPEHLLHPQASAMPLEDFYDFCIRDHRARSQTVGVQCFFLSGARTFAEARPLIAARFSLIAPVEAYDSFVEACAEAADKPVLRAKPSNVGRPDPLVDFARQAIAHRIEQDHLQDLLLHQYVRARFRPTHPGPG